MTTLEGCVIETEAGGYIVTGPSAGAVQLAIEKIMDAITNGSADFTFAKQQADGQWVAVGHIYLNQPPSTVDNSPTAP